MKIIKTVSVTAAVLFWCVAVRYSSGKGFERGPELAEFVISTTFIPVIAFAMAVLFLKGE